MGAGNVWLSDHTIVTATARDIRQIITNFGSFVGPCEAFDGMDVELRVLPFDSRAAETCRFRARPTSGMTDPKYSASAA
jgi:hypothetical protein